jgi:hypothetical protein
MVRTLAAAAPILSSQIPLHAHPYVALYSYTYADTRTEVVATG